MTSNKPALVESKTNVLFKLVDALVKSSSLKKSISKFKLEAGMVCRGNRSLLSRDPTSFLSTLNHFDDVMNKSFYFWIAEEVVDVH